MKITDLLALTLAGPTRHKLVLDPLAVQHLENRFLITLTYALITTAWCRLNEAKNKSEFKITIFKAPWSWGLILA